MYRSGRKDEKKKREVKVVLVFSKVCGSMGYGIHHPVEKSERWTKGSQPVYLTMPSLNSVCYNHLYAGCLSKYNQPGSECGWWVVWRSISSEKNK